MFAWFGRIAYSKLLFLDNENLDSVVFDCCSRFRTTSQAVSRSHATFIILRNLVVKCIV